MRIHYIRHGESQANVANLKGCMNSPLTARGHSQARRLGAYLNQASSDFSRLISSTTARSVQTAAILSEWTGLSFETDPQLNPIGLGAWAGIPEDVLRRRQQRFKGLSPGGESEPAFNHRVRSAISKHLSSTVVGSPLFVVHNSIIKSLLHINVSADGRDAAWGVAPCASNAIDVSASRELAITDTHTPHCQTARWSAVGMGSPRYVCRESSHV